MIIEMGFIIFIGLAFLFVKLPNRMALKLLGRPLFLDIGVSVLAYILHFGTFSGMMAAAVAGMMASVFTTVARRLYGYILGDTYYPGVFAVHNLGDVKHAHTGHRP